jgi:hypothetical protein
MRFRHPRILAALLALAPAAPLHAQTALPPPAAWRAAPPRIPAASARAEADGRLAMRFAAGDSAQSRTHPVTGLAIGAGVGLAAAAVLLSGFCSGGDDICSSGDKARLVFISVVPPAAVGALIGSLVRTHR